MALVAQGPDLEEIYNHIASSNGGITVEELAAAGSWDKTQCTILANKLLTQSRLEIIQAGDKLLLRAVAPQLAAKLSRLDDHMRQVYLQIEKAGDKGAWSKSLKDQTKLQQHTITKATKELIKLQLIKEVKSVHNRNRKVFMLIDLEPSREISGGTWYKDGEFNSSWVEILREHCKTCLDKNPSRPVSLSDLHRYVMQHPGPQVPTEEDVLSIMKTLELDEDVTSTASADGSKCFMKRQTGSLNRPFDLFSARLPNFLSPMEDSPGQMLVPCLCCHLRNDCKAGGRICPEKCEYLTRWLQREEPSTPQDTVMDW
ncbi:unnamed protein product [Effrenium voratum]|uniref:DNA-directed RNA polymerase III subunit RPC6 n=1 Tax=Effrenium voratum TaxID=2562239 RepID=A0AA36JAV2_9DINO|nr:unnamed protein product [Effrenium voratum]